MPATIGYLPVKDDLECRRLRRRSSKLIYRKNTDKFFIAVQNRQPVNTVAAHQSEGMIKIIFVVAHYGANRHHLSGFCLPHAPSFSGASQQNVTICDHAGYLIGFIGFNNRQCADILLLQ